MILWIIVSTNHTLIIAIGGETDTFIPISSQNIVKIFVQNNYPLFKNVPNIIKVKISEGINLSFIYTNYCSTNSTSITVSDDEKDTIYLTIYSDTLEYTQSQIILGALNWKYNLILNTSNLTPGNYSMQFSIHDIFHIDNPAEVEITFHISYFVPPIFESELPSNLGIQIWNKTFINLPSIFDKDGDFTKVIVSPQK